MKFLIPFCFLLPLATHAQSLVDQLPHDRTALLEEFTAIHCGNCPAGHVDAAAIQAAHGDDVVIVGLHAGGLAVPNTGEPDFRNTWATEIHTFYGISSTPKGVVGRRPYGGQTVLSRTSWAAAVNDMLTLPSPVNLGMASSFDPGTRELTVQVELYYTADGTGGSDFITVLLKEDHIIGWQTDYVNGNHTDYDHVNVMRAFLTDTWGDEVTTTTMGTSVLRTYTMTVPADVNENNCSVAAFVGEYQGEVYMVKQVEAIGGTTVGVAESQMVASPVAVFPQPASDHATITFEGEAALVSVLDLAGRPVAEVKAVNGIAHVDVDTWPAGTYVCRVVSDRGVSTGRLVVAR